MHDPRLPDLFDRYRRQGDLAALAKLFDQVSPELLRVARHLAGRGVDAEDVLQSTFLAAIERADSYDATRPLVPWLVGILINQARLANRRRATRREEAVPAELASARREEGGAETHEVQEAVARALRELPPMYREVLVAHLAEGKAPHEIARELGRPQGTVRAQIHRGLRLVRRALPSGFALGLAALLDRSALAAARASVLEAAARARGLPPGAAAIPRAGGVSWAGLVAAGAAAIALVLALAWRVGASPARDGLGATPARVAGAPRDAPAALVATRGPRAGRAQDASDPAAPAAGAATALGAVHVRVRSARGEPATGVRIDLLAWGDPRWHERVREAATDAQGEARFERVHAGRIGVHLDAGPQTREDVRPGQTTELELFLPAGLALRGVVVDAHGAPVAGAWVELVGDALAPPRRVSAPTGPDGRFALDDVERSLAVVACAPGRAPGERVWLGTPSWSSAAPVELVLALGADARADLAIRATDGAPVAGATAVAYVRGATAFRADGSVHLGVGCARARSDAAGRCVLAAEAGAGVRVRVEADGFAPADLPLQEALAGVVLARGARLEGRVRYADQDSPEGVRVSALPRGWLAPLHAFADADGAWRFDGLPPGDVHVSARAGPSAPEVTAELVLGEGGAARWDPLLEHAATIRGRALSTGGVPSRTWLVKAVREDVEASAPIEDWIASAVPLAPEGSLLQSWTAEDGSFVVPCVAGGRYRLELRPRGAWLGPVLGAVDGVEAGARDVLVRLQTERAWVRGRVVGADGLPLAGALFALRHGTASQRQVAVGATGEIALDLYPGTYDFVLWPAGGAPRRVATRRLGEEEACDLGTLRVEAGGDLVVRVDAAGDVRLASADGIPFALERAGAERVARGLPPGSYVLSGAVEREVEVPAGRSVRVE